MKNLDDNKLPHNTERFGQLSQEDLKQILDKVYKVFADEGITVFQSYQVLDAVKEILPKALKVVVMKS